MPRHIHVLALGIFTMVTADFAVSGLMPEIAADLDVSISLVGYLVTAFTLAMALGGPALAVLLTRSAPSRVILTLFAIFLVGNLAAAAAPSYGALFAARLVTGAAAGAFFGVAVTLAASSTTPSQRGRAITVVLQGMTVGTTLGLPLAAWIGGQFGWRSAFGGISALTLLAAAAAVALMPRRNSDPEPSPPLLEDLRSLRSGRLWIALLTSMLVMGATFAAFSYYTPILRTATGIPAASIPLLLLGYGLANIVGNAAVGRLAVRHTYAVLIAGTSINALLLLAFAVATGNPWLAVPAMLATGFVGVTMNPALVARVHQEGPAGTLVNTVHTSMITIGVALGSTLGAVGIELFDERAPLWVGFALAVVATLAILPFARRTSRARSAVAPDRTAS